MQRFCESFLCWLLLLAQIIYTRCDCELRIEGSSPLFLKNYGSRKIVFKVVGNALTIALNETVNAQCSTGTILRNYNTISDLDKRIVYATEIRCNSNNKVAYKRDSDTNFQSTDYNYLSVYCASKVTPNIYETIEQKLPNCEQYSNYALGVKLPPISDLVSLGICYDLDRLKLKFVNYVAYPPNKAFAINEHHLMNPLQIALESKLDGLDHYFQFMSAADFNKSLERLRIEKPLLQSFEFDFESILQDAPISQQLDQFSYLFNTVWWRQLRQHNWRYFLEALLERSKSQSYIVYVGTLGNATIPTPTITHHKYETLTVQSENSEVTAPAYIWAYLRSLDAGATPEELVVIAINSPFAQNPSSHALCTDICDEIDWLANSKFGSLHRTPTLGYVFCCRPQDVAPLIDSFPWQPPQVKSMHSKGHNATMLLGVEIAMLSSNNGA